MKKIIISIITVFLACGLTYAQTAKETIKERKLAYRQARTELKARASKEAKKECKKLTKEGWEVAPGHLSLVKMIDKSYLMYYEYDEGGVPKYIMADASSVGATYDAAKMQALSIAKLNLAGLICTDIVSLVETSMGNMQISNEDAASINQAVQVSKNLISQKLSGVVSVVECFRVKSKDAIEARVTIAYNQRLAMEVAKATIKEQLKEKSEELHKQLEQALAL